MDEIETVFFATYLNIQKKTYDQSSHTIESLKTKNVDEKLQLATALLGDLNHNKSEKQGALEIIINKLSIQLEAVDMRLADLEKDAFTFKREVLSSVTPATFLSSVGKEADDDHDPKKNSHPSYVVKTEKILRHFQSKELQLESTKDKLKLQHMDQKNKLQKIETKLKQKDEQSGTAGSFQYIGFHKLQTENKSFTKELNSKTKELGTVKLSIEKSEKRLIGLNDVLSDGDKKTKNAEKSLDLRRKHLERLKEKIARHNDNIRGINDEQQRKDEITSSFEGKDNEDVSCSKVDVMDIVEQQTKIYELKSLIKTWTRKVEIAQLAKNKEKKASR